MDTLVVDKTGTLTVGDRSSSACTGRRDDDRELLQVA